MTLNEFLRDMRDEKDRYVKVSERDLRAYAQQCKEWEKLANEQTNTI